MTVMYGTHFKVCTSLFSLFIALAPAVLSADGLVISEIMFNPSGNENTHEYVEILNVSSEPISVDGFKIGDGTGFDALVPVIEDEWSVSPGSYALILDPDYFTAEEPYENIPDDVPLFTVDDKAIGSRGLSNTTAEPVYLISADGDTLSVVHYSIECPPGHSWERIFPLGGDSFENFSPSKYEHGTPGRPNSVLPPARNPALDENSLRFYPSSPQIGDDVEVVVTYRNGGLETVSGVSVAVTVLPDFFTGLVHFSDDVLPGDRPSEMSLTLEQIPGGCLGIRAAIISDGDGATALDDTVYSELPVQIPAGVLRLNEVMAAPDEGFSEWVELASTGDFSVDVYKLRIRDGGGSVSDTVDVHSMVEPGEYIVISGGIFDHAESDVRVVTVGRFPALNNDGDSVVLLDCTGSVIDSMMYEDTQPGYSLELISLHMSGETTDWDSCVDPSGSTPGKQNSIYFSNVPDQNGVAGKLVKITIDPNPFLDIAAISYELPFPLARVRLLVYDRRGRLVATIRDVDESGSMWKGTWDGRSGGTRLPAGPYILDFEALDKRSGKMYRERKMIVVASRL